MKSDITMVNTKRFTYVLNNNKYMIELFNGQYILSTWKYDKPENQSIKTYPELIALFTSQGLALKLTGCLELLT